MTNDFGEACFVVIAVCMLGFAFIGIVTVGGFIFDRYMLGDHPHRGCVPCSKGFRSVEAEVITTR